MTTLEAVAARLVTLLLSGVGVAMAVSALTHRLDFGNWGNNSGEAGIPVFFGVLFFIVALCFNAVADSER